MATLSPEVLTTHARTALRPSLPPAFAMAMPMSYHPDPKRAYTHIYYSGNWRSHTHINGVIFTSKLYKNTIRITYIVNK